MAQRTVKVTVPLEGRDYGKKFLITEMYAEHGEKWAMRALNGMAKAGVDLGAVTPLMGMVGLSQALASMSFLAVDAFARMPWDITEPLMDEMFQCIKPYTPDETMTRKMEKGDIEEIATRFWLRGEVLTLHVGFSIPEKLSELIQSYRTSADSENTSTSPEPLDS